jgi:hypothetical protein
MKSALIILLFLTATFSARAEIMVGSSLEWLADTSTAVGVFEVTKSHHKSDSEFDLTFRFHKPLKGNAPQVTTSSYWVRLPKDTDPPTVDEGDRFLIFFKPDERASLRVAHLINLTKSQNGGMDSIAITSKFKILTEEAEILNVVEQRLKAFPKATTSKWREYPNSRFDVEVPTDSPAFRVFYGGSTCYLVVPDDLKTNK